jgi:glutaminyl-tRNA synthetase
LVGLGKSMTESNESRTNFIIQIIDEDLKTGKHEQVVTRFPPEPNGYLHIGHAKSICLNFGLAQRYAGQCFLRFDDTNPIKEEDEYVQAIIEDVKWLGFTWSTMTHASDYYQQLYDYAVILIKQGLAYVDSLTMEEIRAHRGTLEVSGQDSPYRNRPIEENLDLFQRMKTGEFPDGTHVLRAKIDMKSGNVNLRDPVLYRIRHATHQRTQDEWCIYPMYDYAHPISDALEHITHSLCTLEFQDHRPLYEWFIHHLPVPAQPRQIEFSRLNLSHTVTSKRKLRELVEQGVVDGWDDPRLPTLKGMRKRGYPPEALHLFSERVGLSKAESVISMSVLEECVREVLNQTSSRALGVLKPLKVVIENYPAQQVEAFTVPWSSDESKGTRSMPFTQTLYIDQDDFMAEPVPGFFRLAPGKEVRLRHAYVIRCERAVCDEQGNVVELRCTYDKDTLGKNPEGRKVKGVIHWVSSEHAHPIRLIEYDRLFLDANPGADEAFLKRLNPDAMRSFEGYCEPALRDAALGEVFQFERLGYYCVNEVVAQKVASFHRVVALKDTWGKRQDA